MSIRIAGREIGPMKRPYLIAEMSGHNHSLERALAIVDAAAKAGADAIKLQTYTADTMTLDVRAPGFVIDDPTSPWHGRQLYELYQEAHTPWDWHKPIMQRAAERRLACFSTPFDETAIELLESLGTPAYRIASFEITDLELIKNCARTGKPVIISTGMGDEEEIQDAVNTCLDVQNKQYLLLKSTSTYPVSPENSNLRTIPDMSWQYKCDVGLSDHTMGIGVAVAAVGLGAVAIEKHFTLRRADGGVDAAFSMEPEEFAAMRVETERAWRARGYVTYGGTEAEQGSRVLRRSLYFSKPLKAGEVLTRDNVRVVRPGFGLAPKYYFKVLGKTVKQDVGVGTAVQWELLS
jgi:pseudaminic acid synthase